MNRVMHLVLVAAALFLIYAGTTRMGKSGFDLAALPVPDGCRVEHQAVVAIATVQVADQMQAGCLARHMGGSGAGRLAEKGMS